MSSAAVFLAAGPLGLALAGSPVAAAEHLESSSTGNFDIGPSVMKKRRVAIQSVPSSDASSTITSKRIDNSTASTSCSAPSTLGPDERLYADHEPSFICSPNGRYRFGMAPDGDLSLWHPDPVSWNKVWSAGSCCVGTDAYVIMQWQDGNLVVRGYVGGTNSTSVDPQRLVLWKSYKQGAGSVLRVDDDGQARIVRSDGTVKWKTNVNVVPLILEYEPYKPNTTAAGSLTELPTIEEADTYRPGHLIEKKHGLLLSAGLNARIIARSGRTVPLVDGTHSDEEFHILPDHGATFAFQEDHPTKPGGWAYVSNAEGFTKVHGGAGSIFFDREGEVIDYKRVLKNTTRNCGGGKTPWDTWISCEESYDRDGQLHEVDPHGELSSRQTVLGGEGGGEFESFTYDIRDKERPRFFYTEDNFYGALRRFTPSNPDWDNPSEILHNDGVIEYLVFTDVLDGTSGHFDWTTNMTLGNESASLYFPNSEGIDHFNGELFFVSKRKKRLFQLDLDAGNFTSESTKGGAFKGGPDQLTRLVGEEDLLYYTEDGSKHPGVHARDVNGRFFMILESLTWGTYGNVPDETTGVAFSPDQKHLYFAYQKNGIVFDIWRKDGKTFAGRNMDIKYHRLT